jgi:SAM-dependent methyltransferase
MIPKQKAALNLARADVLDVARGQVLDLAAGAGRHSRALAAMGYAVVAVDRDLDGFAEPPPGVTLLKADLELNPWPFANQQFAGVVVTNYLYRPLLPFIVAAIAPGGILIYETFAIGNEQFGRPSRADFLLQPEELLDAVHGELQVIAYENMFVHEPKPATVQRIAAIRKN